MKVQVLRILILSKISQNTGSPFVPYDHRGNRLNNLQQFEKQSIIVDRQQRTDVRFRNNYDVRVPERASVVVGEDVGGLGHFFDRRFSTEYLFAIKIFGHLFCVAAAITHRTLSAVVTRRVYSDGASSSPIETLSFLNSIWLGISSNAVK